MGQLLTLMVFGDAITVNDDNDVENEEANGATISGPPGLDIRDHEIGCSRSDAAATGGLHGTDSSADRAGQRVGEQLRRDLSALDTWKCAVHQHRTGLRGEAQRRPAGSSGNNDDEDDLLATVGDWDPGGRPTEPEAVRDDEDERRLLLDIMSVADRAVRLEALRRYLAAAASDRARPPGTVTAADGKRGFATTGAQRGA